MGDASNRSRKKGRFGGDFGGSEIDFRAVPVLPGKRQDIYNKLLWFEPGPNRPETRGGEGGALAFPRDGHRQAPRPGCIAIDAIEYRDMVKIDPNPEFRSFDGRFLG